jgi:hypothetical protein
MRRERSKYKVSEFGFQPVGGLWYRNPTPETRNLKPGTRNRTPDPRPSFLWNFGIRISDFDLRI